MPTAIDYRYFALGLAIMLCAAAGFETAATGQTNVGQKTSESVVRQPRVEVCFVLDTTGSMSGLIQGAKDKIWSIANEMMSADPAPQIQFGLVAYRDRADSYVTKLYELTDDLDKIYAQLFGFQADGGGDTPESVNQALHEAVTKMKWSEGRDVLKVIFLVGDAPPHMDYVDDVKYPEVCRLAMEKDLIINTIQCGNIDGTAKIWMEIARKSEGQFAAILQSGGTVAMTTPYDEDIARISNDLSATVVAYGDAAVRQSVMDKISRGGGAASEPTADRAEYLHKKRKAAAALGIAGASKVLDGQNDLIEMIVDGKVKLEDVDASQLPAELKDLEADKRRAEIQKRIENRKKLQAEIDQLVSQRGKFIAQEKERLAKSGKADGFDLKVKDMIRQQGVKKGINYKR